ncbi:MAG: demethoxyubiquinone hydroxylase family protein [Deltaproteobacteria bacterium]|nr:demethoxyubiquinone hydroxylase family protein [Deltaproteobacteria bacterium]
MDATVNRALVRADDLLRISLAAVWLLEGLLPKIIFLGPAEIEAFTRTAPFLPMPAETLVPMLGAFEILLGLLLFLGILALPVLWTMLGLLACFSAILVVQTPAVLLDPYGGVIKNLALLGATGALIALRRGAQAPLLRLVHRIRWDVLNEFGADAIYQQHAHAARQVGLGQALQDFAETEREHASAGLDALGRLGSRGPRLGGVVALISTAIGWMTARLGDRWMLRCDLLLERFAIRSYGRSAEQFAAWEEEVLASEFRLMAAAEEEHARRLGDLIQGFQRASGLD